MRIFLLVAALVGTILVTACEETVEIVATPVVDQNGVEPQPPPEAAPGAQPIGTVQKIGDVEVTVHAVRDSLGQEFIQPDAGEKWVIIDIAAMNVGDDPYTLSSMLQTGVRDAEGRNYDMAFGPDTHGTFEGTIPVGGTIRGEVAFAVPVDTLGLVFIFEQAWGTAQAFWTLN